VEWLAADRSRQGVIQITPHMRILVALEAVDGRKGIDSLARLCQEKLEADPFSGWLFVFRSRRGTAIRILVYDGQGFWLAQKRLSKGRFRWWPEGRSPHEVARSLAAHQLQVLLAAGDASATQAAPGWRPVSGVS
jgi:transposase